MPHRLRRLTDDIKGSWPAMPKRQALRWYAMALLHSPAVLKTGTLYAADLSMSNSVRFYLSGKEFDFDIGEIGSGYPYSFLRELFVRQMYFRAFRDLQVSTCLDLGCNLGIVSYVLRGLGEGSARVIGIDAQDFGSHPFRARIATAPGLEFFQGFVCSIELRADPGKLAAACGAHGFDPLIAVTVEEILTRHELTHVDFLKIDIEGAEFDILTDDARWLGSVDNLAMEVHPASGNPRVIVEGLKRQGFRVAWCDPWGYETAPESAGYIYASRVGALAGQFARMHCAGDSPQS